jgi:hypothetical protein
MVTVRAGALLACTAIALAGCLGSHFSADAPSGVSLAGRWKLDRAASDDPQKVLAKMREQANKIIKRQQAEMAARDVPQAEIAPEAPPADGGAPPPGGFGSGGAPPGGPRRDPLRHSPMAAIIRVLIERGDYLTIRQSPGEFVLDFGTFSRSFTPGGHSVVSAEGGVGDQNSGWHHSAYVIRVKPQNGPEVTDVFSLSSDGQHLLETVSIASSELPSEEIKRVYNRTTETAPRQTPSIE